MGSKISNLTNNATIVPARTYIEIEQMDLTAGVRSRRSLLTSAMAFLAGTGRTTETVKGNSDRLGVFEGFAGTYLQARKNDAQNISTTTNTEILFNLEVDEGDKYNPATGRYTVPSTGIYLIIASLNLAAGEWDGVNDTAVLYLGIGGTATAKIASDTVQATASFGPRINGSVFTQLTSGNEISVIAYQNSGSTMTNTTDQNVNYFRVIRIA
jgi:hypothetical protein